MYQVYCSSLYNAFIKELRKNANLSIRQFSEICNLSTGTLSSFENSDNILQNEKTEKLLQYYGYNVGEIIDFDVEFSRLFYEFIHHAVYVQHDLIDDSHEMLMNLLKRYENTALYLGYHIINLFYSIYKDDYFDFDLKYIMKYIDYVSVDIQSLFYTYLGRYYTKINSFDQARKSFEKAQSAIAIDDTYSEMFHYTIANYYMRIGDIHLSIKHSELGIGLFVRKHNFRRLINSNILLANQFFKNEKLSESTQREFGEFKFSK